MRFLRTAALLLVTALFPTVLLADPPAIKAGSLTVAAAADLTFALKEIAVRFEKDTGVKVTMSFGSTGMLARQIEQGAPFDVFFAADARYMDGLKNGGYVIPETVELYGQGRIVLAINRSSGVAMRDLKGLLSTDIKRVAIANPEHAPYGRAAREALKAAGLWEGVKDKLVYGENIRQTLQFIQSGSAEAGIVALSVADVPEITYVMIDPGLYSPINQMAGVVKTANEKGAARAFIKFVNGPEGRPIMKKYGFVLPGQK